MATYDNAFVYGRQSNYQQTYSINSALVYMPNTDTFGEQQDSQASIVKLHNEASTEVRGKFLLQERIYTIYADVYESYRLYFGPISTIDFIRLNSNIYKNIFPKESFDISCINESMNTLVTTNDIQQISHGLSLYDVVYLDTDGKYKKAIAENSKRATPVGVVTKITSPDIFTLITTGMMTYDSVYNYDDTGVLYLSDITPGKLVHYQDIQNAIYVPVAIYTNQGIIVNILQGSIGDALMPYDEFVEPFETYTLFELNELIAQIKEGIRDE